MKNSIGHRKENGMKKLSKIILSVIISALMIVGMISFVFAEGDDIEPFVFDTLDVGGYQEPIPLLVLKISYDANGNGVNDYDDANPTRLFQKDSEYYGEQWCYSMDDLWYERLFADTDSSMKQYYLELSEGRFYYKPAEETYAGEEYNGSVNDGVVNVVIPYKHPQAETGSQSSEVTASRLAAIKAAAEFVDFKSFDKNDDNKIGSTELAILFVNGGYEYSANSGNKPSNKLAFAVHAHYTSGTGVKVGGVTVGNAGFVRLGEYITTKQIASVGVIAHELGHYIGAFDVYDAGGGNWNYIGDMSLMSSGSWNTGKDGVRGNGCAFMDPFNAEICGLVNPLVVTDGEYTLYSHASPHGDYTLLKVFTPDPDEYYLIECRYREDTTKFDNLSNHGYGIVIWHVDDSIVRASSNKTLMSSTSGHDPGLSLMALNGIQSYMAGYSYIDNELKAYAYTFNSNDVKYKFPVSGTPYTSLTEEFSQGFGLIITVKSELSDAMTINISGAYQMGPSLAGSVVGTTTESLELMGRIKSLNGGDVTSCGMILSKSNSDFENGTKIACKPDEDGSFKAVFEGLSSNTKYFCKVYAEGKYGYSERIFSCYTDQIKKERTDYYVVYLYKGLTDVERSYEVKIKPGNTLSYNFPMEKYGYLFAGWYYDSDFEQAYDMSFTQTTCTDFSLYAKWVPVDLAATLKLVGATSKYVFATEAGSPYIAPIPEAKAGYIFTGWYADEECTLPFDFETPAEEPGETIIYAGWKSEKEEETTTVETTIETTTSEVTEEVTTGKSDVTTEKNQGQGSSNTLVIVLVIVGVVAVAAVVVVIIITKKKKNS